MTGHTFRILGVLAVPALHRLFTGSVVGGTLGFTIGSLFDHWGSICDFGRRWLLSTEGVTDFREWLEWRKLNPLFEDLKYEERKEEVATGGDEIEYEVQDDVCTVCYDLSYDTPHRWLEDYKPAIAPRGVVDMRSTSGSSGSPALHKWVGSAIDECHSCQLVVDAVSAYNPSLLAGFDIDAHEYGLPGVHLRAFANPEKPLTVGIIRPWYEWSTSREEVLEVFTDIGDDLCWPTIASAHAVCSNNSTEQALRKMKRWLSECRANHRECRRPNPLYHPRRLVEICEGGGLRLFEPTTPSLYIALSYRWGPFARQMLNTTKSNYHAHKISIETPMLPPALNDAADLARSLGYKYIWMDALCIIQDDDADLDAEIPSMGLLYANADLVLAVDTVDGSHRSFKSNQAFGGSIHFEFVNDPTLYKKTFQTSFTRNTAADVDYTPFSLRSNDAVVNGMHLYMGIGTFCPEETDRLLGQPGIERPSLEAPWSSGVSQSRSESIPHAETHTIYVREAKMAVHLNRSIQDHWNMLNLRGWTLQECRLAAKLLILGITEMNWRCAQASFCECYEAPNSMEKTLDFVEASPPQVHQAAANSRDKEKQERQLYTALINAPSNKVLDRARVYEAWERLVNDYSERRLTRISDRSKALSGIMKIFEKALQSCCLGRERGLYGLWANNILRGLLWRSTSVFHSSSIEFYAWSVHVLKVPAQMPTTEELLAQLRMDTIPDNFLVHHAHYSGKPCFASSLYWPLVKRNYAARPSEDQFPSWSWFSIFGRAQYWGWMYGSEEQTESQNCQDISFEGDATVLDVDSLGLPSSTIMLNCRVASVRLKTLLHGPRRPAPDFCQLYEAANFDQASEYLPFLLPPLMDSTTHYAWIQGTPAPMLFLTDSPCLYGANTKPEDDDPNQWLIDLVRKEYVYALQQRRPQPQHDTDDPVEDTVQQLDVNYDFQEYMPCIDSEQGATTLRSVHLCSDPQCGCKQRWTDPKSYPVVAAYIGAAVTVGLHGKRSITRYSLILVESMCDPGTYQRIGIAVNVQYTALQGYHDPFKGVHKKDITIT